MNGTLPSAFDALAEDYDHRFSWRAPAAWLRESVRLHLAQYLRPGMTVLELGCGTGDDALWLAQQGCRVRATDASERMLELARAKLDGVPGTAVSRFDMNRDDEASLPAGFRAGLVFANFGALNCVAEPARVLRLARSVLEDGGIAAFTVMGRFCLAETLYFGCRGRWRTAARRWRGRATFRGGEVAQPVRYFRPGELVAAARGFERLALIGIGGLLPTSEAFGLWERHPRVFAPLARADRRLGRWLHPVSDHYLLILREGAA